MRVNFDDELFSDNRFRALARKIGDEDKAVGMCYRLWRLAGRHWAHGELIPESALALESLEIMIDVQLAERREGGIYAKGIAERADWYRQRVEAGKHRSNSKSGNRAANGTFLARNGHGAPAVDQRNAVLAGGSLEKRPADSQPLAPVTVSALVSVNALVTNTAPNNQSEALVIARARKEPAGGPPADAGRQSFEVAPLAMSQAQLESPREPEPSQAAVPLELKRRPRGQLLPALSADPGKRQPGQELIGHYCDEWKVNYGSTPPINGQAAGAAKQILAALGLENAKEYVSAYLAIKDQWFLTKHHDLPTLAGSLNKVTTFIASGRSITTTTAKRMELAAENHALIESYFEKNPQFKDK